MLSYLVPVVDKRSHPSQNLHLQLNSICVNSNVKPIKCVGIATDVITVVTSTANNNNTNNNHQTEPISDSEKCLPRLYTNETVNCDAVNKSNDANDNINTNRTTLFTKNSINKTSSSMASIEVQRPKTLSGTMQSQVIGMETVNENDAGCAVGSGGGGGGGGSILLGASLHASHTNDGKHAKPNKLGHTKHAALKRVSFGSSKGSMVETLVFETPTPLPEHAEREFSFPADQTNTSTSTSTAKSSTENASNGNNNSSTTVLDDSGIELQEELERSKVRVSFYQSGKPQLISPPEPYFFDFPDSAPFTTSDEANFSVDPDMATIHSTIPVNYNRQISTDSGWENPFRPGGDLSREADEIVNLIKGGKPITPNDINNSLLNGTTANGHSPENGALTETVTKIEVSQNQQSPTTANDKKNGDANQSNTQVSNSVVPGPQNASHVVVEEKKKKKCTCCVIQ